jgi:histidine ammonia-lyase
MVGAQGADLRAPLKTSPALQRVHKTIRSRIAFLNEDRYMAPDLAVAGDLVMDGTLARSVAAGLLPELG